MPGDSGALSELSLEAVCPQGSIAERWQRAWRLIARTDLRGASPEPDFALVNLGRALIGSCQCPPQTWVGDEGVRQQVGLDHLLLLRLHGGTITGNAAARKVTAFCGDSLIVDCARDFTLTFAAPRLTLLVIPRQACNTARGDGSLHGALFAGTDPAARLVAAQIDELLAMSATLSPARADDTLEVFLAALNALLGPLRHERAALIFDRRDRSLLGRMCRYIDQHLDDRTLGVAALAQTFNVSRATVYRIFSAHGGVATYIRSSRLDQAFEQLRCTPLQPERLNVLARSFGFKTADSFARAFHARFGIRPIQLHSGGREAFAAANRQRHSPGRDGDLTDLDRWLLDLGVRAGQRVE